MKLFSYLWPFLCLDWADYRETVLKVSTLAPNSAQHEFLVQAQTLAVQAKATEAQVNFLSEELTKQRAKTNEFKADVEALELRNDKLNRQVQDLRHTLYDLQAESQSAQDDLINQQQAE